MGGGRARKLPKNIKKEKEGNKKCKTLKE